jgi:hypothetical protein
MVIDRDFSRWYDKALETCRNGNSGTPGWLSNVEAAREIHSGMVASDREQQSASEVTKLRRENAALRDGYADLARRVSAIERIYMSPNGDMGDVIIDVLARVVSTITKKIDALEQRPVESVNLDVDYDGERTLRLGAGDSAKFVTLPIPIDRGAYKSGRFYTRGDVISHNGSAWIAQTAGILPKPPSDDWRLSVRAGRDAPHRKGSVVA